MSSAEEVVILARLTGTREVLANAGAMGLAMEELGVETNLVGTAMEHTARRSYLMNQALFTLRRVMYGVTLGLIGLGVAAFHWGFQFNDTMASARISLSKMLPDMQAVNNELDVLFNLAKFSPFTFQDTTVAFRNMFLGMQSLGISADTVNQTMQSIIDTLSAGGRSTPAALNRVSYALQHMAFQGRLTGQTVNQLGRDGIPVAAILRKEFGLTGDQIHNVGKLGIPVLTFLQAFNKYARESPAIAGAAQRQSMGSFHGLFAQFKDSMGQIMGAVETGFFNRTIHGLQRITGLFNRTSAAIKSSTNATDVITAVAPQALPLWLALSGAIHAVWIDLVAVIKSLRDSKVLWVTVVLGLRALQGVLLVLNPLLQMGAYWLDILIPLWLYYFTYVKLAAIWTGYLKAVEIATTKTTKELTFVQWLLALSMGKYQIILKVTTAATWLYVYAQTAMTVAMERARYAAMLFWLTLEFNPIMLILTAVLLLTAGLVILYFRWKAFHDLVDHTWRWIVNNQHWIALAIGVAFAPLYAAYEVIKKFRDIWNGLKGIGHWFGNVFGGGAASPNSLQRGLSRPAGDLAAPGHALDMPTHPLFGEHVQRVRRGAAANVNPLFNLREGWMGKDKQPIHIHLHVGKKQLASVLTDIETDNLARA